jgi:hypothetical protein
MNASISLMSPASRVLFMRSLVMLKGQIDPAQLFAGSAALKLLVGGFRVIRH